MTSLMTTLDNITNLAKNPLTYVNIKLNRNHGHVQHTLISYFYVASCM